MVVGDAIINGSTVTVVEELQSKTKTEGSSGQHSSYSHVEQVHVIFKEQAQTGWRSKSSSSQEWPFGVKTNNGWQDYSMDDLLFQLKSVVGCFGGG